MHHRYASPAGSRPSGPGGSAAAASGSGMHHKNENSRPRSNNGNIIGALAFSDSLNPNHVSHRCISPAPTWTPGGCRGSLGSHRPNGRLGSLKKPPGQRVSAANVETGPLADTHELEGGSRQLGESTDRRNASDIWECFPFRWGENSLMETAAVPELTPSVSHNATTFWNANRCSLSLAPRVASRRRSRYS